MSKTVFGGVLALGVAVLAWVAWGFGWSNPLALAMTAVIAGVYGVGVRELHRFRVATAGLMAAIQAAPAEPPEDLAPWLDRLPVSLRNPVRWRIEGERVALPSPALTPYLVGLLVMLGMLGTFSGMVVTFKGAVVALEGSADLQAIRAALAAPIKGLGLSFGTSVAGVAASAALGLLSAVSRRERQAAVRRLDRLMHTVFRSFSLVHQRQTAYQAVQAQSQALPAVAAQIERLIGGLEQRNAQLGDQLLSQQATFHQQVQVAYRQLADAVGASLQNSLVAAAQAAGDSLKPVVESAMREMSVESRQLHQRQADAVQHQMQGLSDTWATQTRALTQDVAQLLGRSEALTQTRIESEAQWVRQHGDRMDQWAQVWQQELAAMREDEASRGRAAVARLGDLQAAVAQQLGALGAALEAPMARLMQTAAEAPQAAATVLAQLQRQATEFQERDRQAEQERLAVLAQIANLVQTLGDASGQQRSAIDALVDSTQAVLAQASGRFCDLLAQQTGQASAAVTQVQASAIELSSWGGAFEHGVQQFNATNQQLAEGLQRLETALQQAMARSDEQLAYYVAQAREVIDLSITSQQGIVEDLRRLRTLPVAAAEAA
jgi:hypothetical protein